MRILSVLFGFLAIGLWCAGDGIVGTCAAFCSIHTWCMCNREQDGAEDGEEDQAAP
jgi:hypothetical protein